MFPRWSAGRQGTGYLKLPLIPGGLSRFLRADLWILKYPQGSGIPVHSDPTPGRRHWRLNLVLWAPEEGGIFHCEPPTPRAAFCWGQRLFVFRSDLCPHSVSRIERGSRWVLSAGVALKDRAKRPADGTPG